MTYAAYITQLSLGNSLDDINRFKIVTFKEGDVEYNKGYLIILLINPAGSIVFE